MNFEEPESEDHSERGSDLTEVARIGNCLNLLYDLSSQRCMTWEDRCGDIAAGVRKLQMKRRAVDSSEEEHVGRVMQELATSSQTEENALAQRLWQELFSPTPADNPLNWRQEVSPEWLRPLVDMEQMMQAGIIDETMTLKEAHAVLKSIRNKNKP